jgi:hypothetical protein
MKLKIQVRRFCARAAYNSGCSKTPLPSLIDNNHKNNESSHNNKYTTTQTKVDDGDGDNNSDSTNLE